MAPPSLPGLPGAGRAGRRGGRLVGHVPLSPEGVSELPPDVNTEAWLVRIAHRKAIDLGRARARRPVPTAAIPDRSIDGPAADDNDELWIAIAALPLRQRQAVAFHHLAGRPYAEVAELIGGTAEAARRAASDGIASLRKHFADDQRRG